MDAVLSFAFDHAYVLFGGMIAVFVALLWWIGRPNRWWKWLIDFGAVGAIAIGVLAILFFANVASALDHRLTSLTVTEYGSTTTHKLADYRGKVVFVNYWATWCGPCRAEISDINRVVDAYRGKNVVFLAVTDEDADVIEKFRARFPMHAMVARFTSDEPATKFTAFVYRGRPTTLILDASGNVRQRFIGIRRFEDFDEAIRKAL